jgi:hypothetical protein
VFSSCTPFEIQHIAVTQTLKHLRTLTAFKNLTRKTLLRWILHSNNVSNKRGPFVDIEFEADVWSKLLLLVQINNPETGTTEISIKANVAFCYANIFKACEAMQNSEKWKNNDHITKLNFSKAWTSRLLDRNNFSKRSVSKENKVRPSRREVLEKMREGQNELIRGNYSAAQILNMDETAVHCSLGTRFQYTSKICARACNILNSDDIYIRN